MKNINKSIYIHKYFCSSALFFICAYAFAANIFFYFSAYSEPIKFSQDIGFKKSEIYLFNDDIEELRCFDLNCDSYSDIVFINNPKSKLNIFKDLTTKHEKYEIQSFFFSVFGAFCS